MHPVVSHRPKHNAHLGWAKECFQHQTACIWQYRRHSGGFVDVARADFARHAPQKCIHTIFYSIRAVLNQKEGCPATNGWAEKWTDLSYHETGLSRNRPLSSVDVTKNRTLTIKIPKSAYVARLTAKLTLVWPGPKSDSDQFLCRHSEYQPRLMTMICTCSRLKNLLYFIFSCLKCISTKKSLSRYNSIIMLYSI